MKFFKFTIGLVLFPTLCLSAPLTGVSPAQSTSVSPLAFQEGVHYRVVPQKKTKVRATKKTMGKEVIEFFGYGCPHCYQFEPALNRWVKKKPVDIKFKRVPVVFHADWETHAKLFYTAQELSIFNELFHQAVFKSIHEANNYLNEEKMLVEFFKQKGVEPDRFKKMFKSFSIAHPKMGKVAGAKKEARQYQIRSVPTLAVKLGDKHYVTTITMAGSSDKMLEVVDYLLARH